MRTKVIASKPEVDGDGKRINSWGTKIPLSIKEEKKLDAQELIENLVSAKKLKEQKIKNAALFEFKKVDRDLTPEIIKAMRLLLPGLDQTKLSAKVKILINIDIKMRALLKLVEQATTISEVASISLVKS